MHTQGGVIMSRLTRLGIELGDNEYIYWIGVVMDNTPNNLGLGVTNIL